MVRFLSLIRSDSQTDSASSSSYSKRRASRRDWSLALSRSDSVVFRAPKNYFLPCRLLLVSVTTLLTTGASCRCYWSSVLILGCLGLLPMASESENGLCLAYRKTPGEDGSFITCSECNFGYHLGACSGTTDKMYQGKKTKWS